MEKTVEQKGKNQADMTAKPEVWDCGSSLYDSFELKSFERQLDSAIHSRTLSMPHLSDRRVVHHLPQPQPLSSSDQQPQPSTMLKKSSKISRSFQKLLRSVFKPKQNQRPLFQDQSRDGFYVVYDKSAALCTIPEVPEFDAGVSPDIRSLVRRTTSDRFTATPIGISCA